MAFLCAYSGDCAQQTPDYPAVLSENAPLPEGAEVSAACFDRMTHVFGAWESRRVPKDLLLDLVFEFTNRDNYRGVALAYSDDVNADALRDCKGSCRLNP